MNPEIINAIYSEELYQTDERLTVVIHQPWSKFTTDEINLLTKILASVGQSLNSIHITELSGHPGLSSPNVSRVISFGGDIFPDIPLYQFTRVHDISVVKAGLLSELDDVKKKNLWSALRLMFNL